jgi:hypothetical protein
VDASRFSTNIRRSIQVLMGNLVEINGVDYPIYHDYSFADPDDAADTNNPSPNDAWIETVTLSQTAGRRGFTLLQLDIFSKIGGEGEAAGDPFGLRADAMADAMESIFSGIGANCSLRSYIRVNDYADVNNPVATDRFILGQNSAGDVGVCEERTRKPSEDGLRRIILTYRFRLLQDAAGPAAFYTD